MQKDEFPSITVERALKHPSWVMGTKITIDSATWFNKGLDMCLPIQFALTYPTRVPSERLLANLAELGGMTFEELDKE